MSKKLLGSAVPRIGIWNEGNASFFPAVLKKAKELGLTPFPWQETVLKAMYAVDTWVGDDGQKHWRWANPVVCVSTGRQPGKGRVAEMVELIDITLFGASTVLHTGQGAGTTNKAALKMGALIDSYNSRAGEDALDCKLFDDWGREMVRFNTRVSVKPLPVGYDEDKKSVLDNESQRIRYVTRTKEKMMGESVDTLVIDESSVLSVEEWEEVLPTLAARIYSHALLIGNPPTDAKKQQFHSYRERALKSLEDGSRAPVAWLEWAADEFDDWHSPEVWAKAHPGYGYSVSHEQFEGFYKDFPEDKFKRQMLGMWGVETGEFVIPLQSWLQQRDETSRIVSDIVIGVDVDYTGQNSAVAIAGRLDDGSYKMDLVDFAPGTDWIVDRVEEICNSADVQAIVCEKYSRVNDLILEFEERGLFVTVASREDYVRGCDLVESGIMSGWLFHSGDANLNLALEGAVWKYNTEGGGRRWDRKKGGSPLYALIAGTMAVWGAKMNSEYPEKLIAVKGFVDPWADRRGMIIFG